MRTQGNQDTRLPQVSMKVQDFTLSEEMSKIYSNLVLLILSKI